MGRPPLSEEAEREELLDRDRLRQLQSKARELRGRRSFLLDQIRQLSSEQKALYDRRVAEEATVGPIHDEYRAIGRQLGEFRAARDRARAALEQAVIALREARGQMPRALPSRPEAIGREIAELARRQETVALPIAEENALIDRIRLLRKELVVAEAEKEHTAAAQSRMRELEQAVAQRREEFHRAGRELEARRHDREQRMESIKARLVQTGQVVAALREKARARAPLMERLDGLQRQINETELAVRAILRASSGRRQEAREAIAQYNRAVRATGSDGSQRDQRADQQLEELLRRGKVTLGS